YCLFTSCILTFSLSKANYSFLELKNLPALQARRYNHLAILCITDLLRYPFILSANFVFLCITLLLFVAICIAFFVPINTKRSSALVIPVYIRFLASII